MIATLLIISSLNLQAADTLKKDGTMMVELSAESASVKEILESLEAQTDFRFFYNHRAMSNSGKVTISPSSVSFEEALQVLANRADLVFKVQGDQIVVKKRAAVPLLTSLFSNESAAITKKDLDRLLTVSRELTISADISVSGQVLDENSSPMPGVNILVKGTTIGTSTDTEGKYVIDVPNGDAVLVFSFVGYMSREIMVGSQSTINVNMEPDASTLTEIVVVGYGTQKKSSVTGAVQSINSKDISALPTPSVAQALQGRVPGVLVTSNGGPGTSQIVRIRGIGSITQGSDPLYVVDGFPMGTGFNLNMIDSKDIESVEVLKDAAASAIYGSRAANGVILISTKSGSKDQKVHVDIEYYRGTQSAWKKLDLLNSDQYIEYGTELLTNAGSALPTRWSNMNVPIYAGTTQTFAETETDWQDEMFQAAPISQFQGSLSNANDKSKMYASFGRFQQEGIMIGTGYTRYNGRINFETKVNKRLTVGENVVVVQSTQQQQPESGGRTMFMHMIRSVPYIEVRNPNVVGGFNGTLGADLSDPENPVRVSLQDTRVSTNVNILSNTFAQVSLIEGLKYKFTFGARYDVGKFNSNNPIFNDGGFQGRAQHEITENRNTGYGLYYSNQLTYDKTIGGSTINAIVVGERQDDKGTFLNTFGRLTTNDINQLQGVTGQTVTGGLNETVLISYLGRVNYDYKGKYLLSASYRRDGFSGFAPGNKWGNFPGASVGWKISEESFMSGISKITDLKLRASYGKVGARPQQAYSYIAPINANTAYPFNNALGQGTYFNKLPNAQFGWEISEMNNIGIDLAMFNNQFTFSAEYFVKNTEGLILGAQPAWSLGLDSGTDLNIAEMKNWGYEFVAGFNKTSEDFTLNISGNVSIIKNEVIALDSEVAALFAGSNQDYGNGAFTRTIAGHSIQHFYVEGTDGIYQSVAEIIGSDSRPTQSNLRLPLLPDGTVDLAAYNDPANIGSYTRPGDIRFTGLYEAGSFLPKLTYGLNASATYKGFDLTLFLQGVQGNKIYNGVRVITEGMQRLFNSGVEVLDAWTPTNTDTSVPRAVSGDPNGNARPSDRFLEDGSYMRIKNLNIGYTFPASMLNFADGALTKFRIYVQAQNLLTVTKYNGYDPEIGSRNGATLTNGVDYGQFPQPRTFLAGVQIGF